MFAPQAQEAALYRLYEYCDRDSTGSLLQHEVPANVSVGSLASVLAHAADVRFAPNSDHKADIPKPTLCANRVTCAGKCAAANALPSSIARVTGSYRVRG